MAGLKVTTFSSKGRATRIYGLKTKRIHHLHSDNQLKAFLLFEWSDKVIDIEESVPLVDLEANLYDIENLRLDKFKNKEEGEIYQLHTNFLITLNEQGKEKLKAISVKNLSELERKTVIEKMEIERRYWKGKGVEFSVITDMDKQFVKNIIWVRETLTNDDIKDKGLLADKLYWHLRENENGIVNNLLKDFESENLLQEGIGLYIFRYLIGTKQVAVNMKEKVNLNMEVKALIHF